MDDLKKFFTYGIMLVGFLIISTLLEHGLIMDMYSTIEGSIKGNDNIKVEVLESKATNVNGRMDVKITNDSNEKIDSAFAKIDLLDEYGQVAITKYTTIENLEPGDYKDYKISFRGNKIKGYNVELVKEIPDKTNIINILGWEFDKTNLFGLGIDLTNINGVDISEYFKLENIKGFLVDKWKVGVGIVKSIPIWAYAIASLCILWYM